MGSGGGAFEGGPVEPAHVEKLGVMPPGSFAVGVVGDGGCAGLEGALVP